MTSPAGPRPGKFSGLDIRANPIPINSRAPLDRQLWSAPPLRDVDWRNGNWKVCWLPSKRQAAYVQRAGFAAPEGHACKKCANGLGPFASCCVMIVCGELVFAGGCASCNFTSNGQKCSFQKSEHLPKWILEPLHQQNPSHPLVEAALRASHTRANPRQQEQSSQASVVSAASPSTPHVGAFAYVPRKRRAVEDAPTTLVRKTVKVLSPSPLTSSTHISARKDQTRAYSSRKDKVEPPKFSEQWYTSPIENPEILKAYADEDFATIRKAFREISHLRERLEFDRALNSIAPPLRRPSLGAVLSRVPSLRKSPRPTLS
ncbi:hypothetical protein PENDEC_c023G00683 [Penicillium decumbens]|uniref:Uncharacterized protein n=1 Tax=Penicillium decumbens TaxID=69771 RepID=A0A1V6P0D5_PENDC|nr:hypothetical protein PENDEC_c023G00683 [Penicillium decumbens]